MKQLKIKSLKLTNFKGQTRDVQLEGDNIVVSGRNGAGKTTLFKAWSWLITGITDAHNVANHELYDNKAELSPDTPLAEVEASILLDDFEYKMKRTAKAKFTRPRGQEEYEKAKSDEYKLYIDDIEYSSTNFKAWIDKNVAPTDALVYCLNGEFFANLSIDDKDKAIKIIHNIVGEINKSDFKGEYGLLFKTMERLSLSEIKAQTKAKMKPVKDRINILPEVIASKESEVSKYREIDFDGIAKDILKTENEIKTLDSTMSNSSESLKPYIDKRNKELSEIERLKILLSEKKIAYNREQASKPNKAQEELQKAFNENLAIKQRNKQLQDDFDRSLYNVSTLKKDASIIEKELTGLRTQLAEVKGRVFEAESCAYCGQELPLEKIEVLKAKFNTQKESDRQIIVAKGKSKAEQLSKINDTIAGLESKSANGLILEPLIDLTELDAKARAEVSEMVSFESTSEYKTLTDSISKAESSLTTIPSIDTAELSSKKVELMEKLKVLNQKYGEKSIILDLENELENLRNEQRTQTNALAALQRIEIEIENYEREKATIASSKVNDLLEYCMIETQEKQKDGNYKDSCTILLRNGVKYSTANNGSRILALVDIQRMFSRYYGIAMPIWIDECLILDEDKRPRYDNTQVICIIRDNCDLKIEIA